MAYRSELAQGVRNEERLDAAIIHLRRATGLDPRGFLGFANLAQALQLKGDAAGAAEAARRSLELSPGTWGVPRWEVDPTIAAAAGAVLEWAGHGEEAVAAYARAIHLDPTLSQSPFWASTPERQALRWRAIEASGISACELGRYAALYGSNIAEMRGLTDACRINSRTETDLTSLAMMLEAQGMHGEALQLAQEAIRGSGGSAEARTALGYVLAEDDVTRARRHFLAGDYDAPLLLALTYTSGVAVDQGPPAVVLQGVDQLSSGRSYGRSYYQVVLRRSAPEAVLIPGDWQQLRSPRTTQAAEIVERYQHQESGIHVLEALVLSPALDAYPGLGYAFTAAVTALLGLGLYLAHRRDAKSPVLQSTKLTN
jgi:hypothetical protein